MTKKKEDAVLASAVLKLDVRERLQIGNLMPERGNYFEMIVGKHVQKKFELSSKEVEAIELKNTQTGITWNPDKEMPKDIELTGTEIDFLKTQINRLSEENQLPFNMLGLCEKIMDI